MWILSGRSEKQPCATDLWSGVTANQEGSVLLIALLVLLAVTIFGVVSLNTSSVELHIARNERDVREVFYLAEAGVMEGVQSLVDTKQIDLEEKFLFWHHAAKDIEAQQVNFRNPGHWIPSEEAEKNARPCAISPETYLAAVEWDVATGDSLVMTEPRLYVNRIYSLCQKNNSSEIIEVGYRLRY
jgi:Tfp pilus assembly protein PilX